MSIPQNTRPAYSTKYGRVYRHKFPGGSDETRLIVPDAATAEKACQKLKGRYLRVSKMGTGFFPLHVYVGNTFFGIAGTAPRFM